VTMIHTTLAIEQSPKACAPLTLILVHRGLAARRTIG